MGVLGNNALVGASAAGAGGGANFYEHQIANSTRYNQSASAHMYRTNGTPTNADKCTMSAWVKRTKLGSHTAFTGAYDSAGWGGGYLTIGMENGDNFKFLHHPDSNAGTQGQITSDALYRDSSAFYHVVVAYDSSQGTAANRVKIYINGSQLTDITATTYPDQNQDFILNKSGCKIFIGSGGDSGGNAYQPWDGYIAEYVMIDGTAYAASDFGETKNGVWIPKDPSGLTFGNNGCYLKFESSSDLGNDSSGNNNDFTVSNVSAHDQMLDTPTFNSDSNGGNFCTLNPLFPDPTVARITNGNLQWGGSEGGGSVNEMGCMSTFAIPPSDTNIYYFEARMKVGPSGGVEQAIGVNVPTVDLTSDRGGRPTAWCISNNADQRIYNGANSYTTTGVSGSAGDIVGVEIDRANTTIKFYVNGTLRGTQTNLNTTTDLYPWVGTGGSTSDTLGWDMNFGQNGSFNGLATAQGETDATGYGNFYYDEAGSCKALCTGNLPISSEIDPAQNSDNYPQKLVDPIIYTGTGSEKAVAVGWQPDLTWVKERGGANDNKLTDSVRGATKALESNTNAAETTDAQGVKAFTSTGFTLGTDAVYNNNTDTYVAWNWKEGADYGLDIVTYSGTLTGSGVVNISHSLGAIPECIWHMRRTDLGGAIRHKDLTDANYIISNNDTMGGSSGTGWGKSVQGSKSGNGNMTALGTSSTFTTNYTGLLNENGNTYVAYVWRGIEGFSKFGSYEGNGSGTDGPFIYTGFRPALVIIKNADANASFFLQDNARDLYNPTYHVLKPNVSNAEEAYTDGTDYNDFLSNGFKVARGGDPANFNVSNNTYIYMAWAHNPFKYSLAR